MPSTIIIIFTIVSVLLVFWLYGLRFLNLHRGKYQVNPLSPLAWSANGVLNLVFVFVSHNFIIFAISCSGLLLNIILWMWSLSNMRKKANAEWKIEVSDYVCFGFAIAAGVIFALTRSAALGICVTFAGQVLSDLPQLRKAYVSPSTDGIIYYVLPTVYFFVLAGTLKTFNFVGLAQSVGWGLLFTGETLWQFFCQKRLAGRGAVADDARITS